VTKGEQEALRTAIDRLRQARSELLDRSSDEGSSQQILTLSEVIDETLELAVRAFARGGDNAAPAAPEEKTQLLLQATERLDYMLRAAAALPLLAKAAFDAAGTTRDFTVLMSHGDPTSDYD
jgi:hypothetical protein